MPRTTPAVLAFAAVTTLGAASADAQEILDPGTRPMWAALHLGPAIGVVNINVTQFKLEQEFGYHFSGDSSGPALGLNIGESFGSGVFVFTPGAKFWWDIQPASDYAIYIAPQAKIGYGLFTNGATLHTFNWSLGVEGRLILGDRGLIVFRPFSLDMYAGDTDFLMRYDLMFGGGVTF